MNILRKALSAMTVLIATLAQANSAPITHITVRDAQFVIVKEIKLQSELLQFQTHWAAKKASQPEAVPAAFTYKLDIRSGQDSVRWLYSPQGVTQILSKKKVPLFAIQDPQAFNLLMGVAPHKQEPLKTK